MRISDWSSDVCSSDLSAAARQLGLEPTGHAARGGGVSPGNLAMAAGKVPRDTLIGEIEHGVLVTEVIGQGVNLITGDYRHGASGFLIDGGEIVATVSEVQIAGQLKAMFDGARTEEGQERKG